MKDEELQKLAEQLAAEIKSAKELATKEDLARAKEAFTAPIEESGLLGLLGYVKRFLNGVMVIHGLISEAIYKVETFSASVKLAGEQKKELAVRIVNILVDIPYVPEKLEAWIFSYIIELLIREFNKRFGKTWLAKVVA